MDEVPQALSRRRQFRSAHGEICGVNSIEL